MGIKMKRVVLIFCIIMFLPLFSCENTVKNDDAEILKSLSLYFWEDAKYIGDTVNLLNCTNLFYSMSNPEHNENDQTNRYFSDTVRFFSIDTISQFETYLFELTNGYYIDIIKNTATIRKK